MLALAAMRGIARWLAGCAMVGAGASPVHAGGWTHPVAGTTEPVPPRDTSRFGAARGDGTRPEECGQGHCGIDLYGPKGLPIVAFADGWVVLLDREAGGPGGRRLVIAHPGGAMTHYLHLDVIRQDLELGRFVESGEWIATLGTTGIHFSPPHLHFGLSITSSGERTYIDPRPFLELARVIDGPPRVSCVVVPETARPAPPVVALPRKNGPRRRSARREAASR